jgi:hypothetical protein
MPAALLAPVTLDPDCTAVGRAAILAADPDIAMTIPAVIARDPDPTFMGCDRYNFYGTRRRRSNTHYDLSIGRADRQK